MIKTSASLPADCSAARTERNLALVTIIVPWLVFLAAVVVFWDRGISALDLTLCGIFYVITMLGITLGYHRLFTHHSFKCGAPLRTALCISGSMAAQGPVFFWTACHRRHHRHSDDASDPHSPHHSGHGLAGILVGWWHSHIGWMFSHTPENYVRLVPDLIREPLLRALNRFYFYWVFAGLLLPGFLALAITGNWTAFLTGVLWGGFVRMFLVHHSTWSINSICHIFGSSPYETEDQSRNNLVCAVLTLGEGWHNNHHAFPTSARHGLEWWQCDVVYGIIRGLSWVGLTWDIRVPSAEQKGSKIRTKSSKPVAPTKPAGLSPGPTVARPAAIQLHFRSNR